MSISARITRAFAAALFLLLAALVAGGCSAKETPGGPIPGQTQLEPCPVEKGASVLVTVSGEEEEVCENFAALVTTTLQSELGLRPARQAQEADVRVDIVLKDIYLAASDETRMSASHTLANTAMGTTLGLVVGSLAGNRSGALIGSGVGAALGLGVSAMDSRRRNTWAIDSAVTIRRRGQEALTQPYRTSVSDMDLDREAAVDALGTALSTDLARALR